MADTMNFGPEWLRTLSSQGGGSNTGPLSPSKPIQNSTTPTASLAKKFKLAEFRYGKEELLQLFAENPELPEGMPVLPPISSDRCSMPLAFMPLSEEEQMAMSAGVNSGTVYGIRPGRGFYTSRGGRGGRGRGRGEYNRSASYSEEYGSERGSYGGNYYGNRGGGTASTPAGTSSEPWPEGGVTGRGGGYAPTGGRGASRANQDDNWRSPTTPQEEKPSTGPPAWGNHWQPPPSPGGKPQSSGKAWQPIDKDASNPSQPKWNPLPEWASDDSGGGQGVGTFDSSGHFTSSSKDKPSESTPPDSTVEGEKNPSKPRPPNKLMLGQPPPSHKAKTKPPDLTQVQDTAQSHSQSQYHGNNVPSYSRKILQTPEPAVTEKIPSSETSRPPSIQDKPVITSSSSNNAQVSYSSRLQQSPSVGHPPQQIFTSSGGTHGGGGDGGDVLRTAVPSSSPAVPISSGHMISHDQDDSVFSPSSMDDERMKIIEQAAEALLSTEEEDTPTPSPITKKTVQQKTTPILDNTPTLGSSPSPSPDMNKWLYKDPQGEIQGPFTSGDMKKWYEAGYFTMDLMVRRACDMVFMPLGQVINVWGRVPFNAGNSVPPPIRPDNTFWHRVFQQQQFLFQQQQLLLVQKQMQQQTASSSMNPSATTNQKAGAGARSGKAQQGLAAGPRNSDSIWGSNKGKSTNGDQWPEITGVVDSGWDTVSPNNTTPQQQLSSQAPPIDHTQQQQQEKDAALEKARHKESEERKREQEKRLKLEAEHQRQEEEEEKRQEENEARAKMEAAEKRKRELEAEKQRKVEEERQREAMAELERRRQQREEEARLLLQRQQMQRREEMKAQVERERERQMLTERERERQMLAERDRQILAEGERLVRQQHQQQQSMAWMQAGSAAGGGGGGGGGPTARQNTASLIQIQQEEVLASEKRQREEMKMYQLQQQMRQQQQQQQLGQAGGWASAGSGGGLGQVGISASPGGGMAKPKSFLEIQHEQESDFQPHPPLPQAPVTTPTKPVGSKPKNSSSWSSVAKQRQAQTTPSWTPISPAQNIPSSNISGVNSSSSSHHQQQQQQQQQPQQRHRNHSFTPSEENEDEEEMAFWDECEKEAKKNPPPTRTGTKSASGDGGGAKGNGGGKKKSVDKEEQKLRRLLSANEASSEFNSWCDQELHKFNTDVDSATFISFLLEVDSVYEVHDYIKSYLGESTAAHDFTKQFLEKRQKVKPPSQQSKKSKTRERASSSSKAEDSTNRADNEGTDLFGGSVGSEGGAGGGKANKKKKKKMQKVNPAAMLGFTVNAADRPNVGEIQTVRDAT